MIEKLKYIFSTQNDPYYNLALEEFLFENVKSNECILYLWQNKNTVVIGKNQNCYKECNIEKIKQNSINIARRITGGGAVFHDLGNLNFTFLINKKDYDLQKQYQVILEAINALGIQAQKTSRNDLTVDGRKFSGNAFYNNAQTCLHHGTLMVNVKTQKLSEFLNVEKSKLAAKGVDSVKARVINLKHYAPNLNIEKLEVSLLKSFKHIYNLEPELICEKDLNLKALDLKIKKFSDPEWIYGEKFDCNYEISDRFGWGAVELKLKIKKDIIEDLIIYSDALDETFIEAICAALRGCQFFIYRIELILEELKAKNDLQKIMKSDILSLLKYNLI